MKWEIPPIIKVYEALGSIADQRVDIKNLSAKVYSSSREKFYTVRYEPESNSIMTNDNGSYYVGYLGYPAIAYLMKIRELEFSKDYANALAGIKWKDINVKFKNDFLKTQEFVDKIVENKGFDLDKFHEYLKSILEQIKSMNLNLLGEKEQPPKGY